MSIMKTKSFWLATIMTLICSVAGILLAKLPYVNLIGALVLALLLGIAMQLAPDGLRTEAKAGVGFISNKFLRLGIILLGFTWSSLLTPELRRSWWPSWPLLGPSS